jgi:hypothetical protein
MSSSSSDYKFAGWGAFGPDSIQGKFKWFEYEPKQFADDDVDSEQARVPYTLSHGRLPLYFAVG